MKYKLISDVINIVIPAGEIPDVKWNKIPSKECYGNFDLLYDEDLAQSDLLVHDARGKLGLNLTAGPRTMMLRDSKKTPATWK